MAISNIDNVKTGIETDINNGVPLIDGDTVRDNMVDSLETVNAASGILFEYVASLGALASGKFTMLEADGSTVTSDPSQAQYLRFYEDDISGANIEALIGLDDFAIYMRSTGGYYSLFEATSMTASTPTVIGCEISTPSLSSTIAVDEVVKFEFLNKFSSGVSADLDTVMENGSVASVDSIISIQAENANSASLITNDGNLGIFSLGSGDVIVSSNDGLIGMSSGTNVNITGNTGVNLTSSAGIIASQGRKVQTAQYGTTANRPSSPVIGETYFDTDKGYRIDYNGTNWVNASGATV